MKEIGFNAKTRAARGGEEANQGNREWLTPVTARSPDTSGLVAYLVASVDRRVRRLQVVVDQENRLRSCSAQQEEAKGVGRHHLQGAEVSTASQGSWEHLPW